jgi:tetratricopeptide (TPR) repeat protein
LVYNFTWVAQSRFQEILVPGVRSSYIEIAWREFQTAPIFGTSPGNFLYSSRLYRHEWSQGDAMYTHNDWLQLLAEYGWVGFSLAVIALFLLLANGIKRFLQVVGLQIEAGERPQSNEGAIAAGTFAVAVLYAVHSIVDFNFHVPVNAMLAAVVLGLLAASPRPSAKILVRRWPRQVSRWLVVLGFLGFGGGLLWQLLHFGKSDWMVLKARNALVTGDSAEAYVQATEALKSYPEDPQWWITKAQSARAYETDAILKAIPKVSAASLAASATIEPEEILADQEEIPAGFDEAKRAELLAAALKAYEKSVQLRPKERQFLSEWTDSLAAAGDAPSVRKHSIRAIQLDPWSGYAYAKYGEALETLGTRQEALEIFRLGSNIAHGAAARAARDRILGDEALEQELLRLEAQPE